jgi:hypothetical protein
MHCACCGEVLEEDDTLDGEFCNECFIMLTDPEKSDGYDESEYDSEDEDDAIL